MKRYMLKCFIASTSYESRRHSGQHVSQCLVNCEPIIEVIVQFRCDFHLFGVYEYFLEDSVLCH